MIVAMLKPWQWVPRLAPIMVEESSAIAGLLWRSSRMLWAITLIELRKRHAGSVLGVLWFPIYSALFLAMYAFVYIKVFKGRFENYGPYETTLFIFCGMIPYLGFSEAIATSSSSVKSNIVLIKNTIFPAELIPVKHVLVAMGGMLSSLALLLILLLASPFRGLHMLYLPVPLLLLVVFCLGAAWFLASVAALLPDVTQIINLILLLALFLSPIGYPLSQIQGKAALVLYANPLTYLIESFRFSLMGVRETPMWADAAFFGASLLVAAAGGTFFRRLKPVFADYE